MRAMVMEQPGKELKLSDVPIPHPGPGEILVRVLACGVCRTDLHVFDGELPNPKLPLILGHEIVGIVEELGEGVSSFKRGSGSEFPGLQAPANIANSALVKMKTSVTMPFILDIFAMGVMQNIAYRTKNTLFLFQTITLFCMRPRFFARG